MAALPRPIPFVGVPSQRDTSGTEDERFVNVLFEETVNPLLREHTINVVKRPGFSTHIQPPGLSATGRGLYAWGATGKIYSVSNNRIYSNTTAIGATLAGSSGMVSWVETPASTGQQMLIMSDGTDNYNINTLDNVVTIDESDDTDYPTPNLGSIVYLDGYTFLGKSNGRLYNFDLNSFTSIGAASFLSVDTHGGALVAFHIQKDQIIAFTRNRTEFFFNNGNPSGSPLLRIDQNTLGVGCAAKQSVAFSGEILCFVGENPSDGGGGRAVWMITSLGSVKEISNATINRFLDSEGTSISTCTAWMERVNGQLLYVLNLDSSERTFVYSVDRGMWCEWTDVADGTKFWGVAVTSLNGVIYAQHASSGFINKLDRTLFQDTTLNFPVILQTPRSNFGFTGRKWEDSVSIIGDTSTGNLVLTVSDDDGATYGASRNIDMSLKEKKIKRVGGAFYERSHKFTFTANAALRLQAWVPEIRV